MGITQERKNFDYHQRIVCEHCGSYGRYRVYMTYMCLSLFHRAVFTTSGATEPMKLAVKLKKTYPEEEIRDWMYGYG